jgi:hypothetical protein
MRIKAHVLGIDVEYNDGAITCSADGVPQGVYTMGATMIVGSTELPADIRRAIAVELRRLLSAVSTWITP